MMQLEPLYDHLWLYHNLFQPVMRLYSKETVAPLRYRRTFDPAKPPLDRLIRTEMPMWHKAKPAGGITPMQPIRCS